MKIGSLLILLLFTNLFVIAQPTPEGQRKPASETLQEEENIPKNLLPVFNLVNADNILEARRILDSLVQSAPDEIDYLSTKIIFHLQYRQYQEACGLILRVSELANRKGYTRFTTREELEGLRKEYCPSE